MINHDRVFTNMYEACVVGYVESTFLVLGFLSTVARKQLNINGTPEQTSDLTWTMAVGNSRVVGSRTVETSRTRTV